MKITERLNVEHVVFLTMLERLEDLVQSKAPTEVLAGVAQTILGVIVSPGRGVDPRRDAGADVRLVRRPRP